MATVVPSFSDAHLQELCKVLGDSATGTELTRLLTEARVDDSVGEGATKWRRLHAALSERQRRDGHANAVCGFIRRVMEPVRFGDSPERYDAMREALNVRLAFAGLRVREDGQVVRVTASRTLTEAHERTRNDVLSLGSTSPGPASRLRRSVGFRLTRAGRWRHDLRATSFMKPRTLRLAVFAPGRHQVELTEGVRP